MADPDDKSALVIVPDYQLSLAIGKEGQNARLAARLTGFKIDIKSETQAREAGDFEYYQDEEGYEDEFDEDYDEFAEESYDADADGEFAEENDGAYADSESAGDYDEQEYGEE